MLKLVRYLRHYRKECVLAPLFKLLEAIFGLLVPLVMAQVIDTGLATGDRSYIIGRGILLVVMGIVGLAFALTAQYFCAKLGAGFGTELRDDLFRHIMGLSRADVDRLGKATLVTRVTNDSQVVQDSVNMFFRLVLRSPFVVFGALVLSFLVDGTEGLIYTGTIVALLVIVFAVTRAASRRYVRVQRLLDDVDLSTSQNLEGVRVIRAFRREASEVADFDATATRLRGEQVGVGDVAGLANPLTYAVTNLGLVAVLWVGGLNVDVGTMTQGQLVALVNYSAQILVELVKLANLIVQLSRASGCADRLNEVFATTSSMADGTADATDAAPSVEFRDVTFAYPGAAAPALADVSFTVEPGEVVGIIGGTGSGKTTLADLVMRFYDTTSGQVLVGGRDVRDYSMQSLRRLAGIVEQGPVLFSGTIASNLRWGDQAATDEALLAAASTAQATEVIDRKDAGLAEPVEQLGRNFSGGQRQRLAIARTLARRPRILILDDSSSALDFATDAALRRALRRDCADATCLVISQRVTSIQDASKILVLDRGRLVGQGTHEDLLASCALYREIYDSQVKADEGATDEKDAAEKSASAPAATVAPATPARGGEADA